MQYYAILGRYYEYRSKNCAYRSVGVVVLRIAQRVSVTAMRIFFLANGCGLLDGVLHGAVLICYVTNVPVILLLF